MTGAEFKAGREHLGLTAERLAWLMGYARGRATIYDIEARAEVVGPPAKVMEALLDGWRPGKEKQVLQPGGEAMAGKLWVQNIVQTLTMPPGKE